MSKHPLDGMKVAILVADGFEQAEMTEPRGGGRGASVARLNCWCQPASTVFVRARTHVRMTLAEREGLGLK